MAKHTCPMPPEAPATTKGPQQLSQQVSEVWELSTSFDHFAKCSVCEIAASWGGGEARGGGNGMILDVGGA